MANGVAQAVLHGVALGVRLDVSAPRMASALAIPVPVHTLETVVPIAPVLVGGAHARDQTTLRGSAQRHTATRVSPLAGLDNGLSHWTRTLESNMNPPPNAT